MLIKSCCELARISALSWLRVYISISFSKYSSISALRLKAVVLSIVRLGITTSLNPVFCSVICPEPMHKGKLEIKTPFESVTPNGHDAYNPQPYVTSTPSRDEIGDDGTVVDMDDVRGLIIEFIGLEPFFVTLIVMLLDILCFLLQNKVSAMSSSLVSCV